MNRLAEVFALIANVETTTMKTGPTARGKPGPAIWWHKQVGARCGPGDQAHISLAGASLASTVLGRTPVVETIDLDSARDNSRRGEKS